MAICLALDLTVPRQPPRGELWPATLPSTYTYLTQNNSLYSETENTSSLYLIIMLQLFTTGMSANINIARTQNKHFVFDIIETKLVLFYGFYGYHHRATRGKYISNKINVVYFITFRLKYSVPKYILLNIQFK